MAAVEKRKNGWAALFLNHLMFMIIASFMVILLTGIPRLLIGGAICLLYFHSVHEYCRKAGREHSQPYIETNPSWKFPLYYGLIGNVYFWLPIIMNFTVGMLFEKGSVGKIVVNIIYLVTNSPFVFANVVTSNDYNVLNPAPVIVFTLLFFASTFSGYYLGIHGKSLAKYLSRFRKKKKKKKTGGAK